MMKRILVGLAFCAAASPAFAEDGGVVGKLVTPNGTPIKGYPVVVSGKTESGLVQDWISATDSTGTFMVNALPPGQYTFAPANEPSATTNFSIEPTTTQNTNLGAIQVAPGAKF